MSYINKTSALVITSLFLTVNGAAAFAAESAPTLSGKVVTDGSSTVFLISEAVGEEFQNANPDVKVAVAVSGTGGGFKKFCKGEVDIAGASRAIEAAEIDACKTAGIEFAELPVAYDGIALVVPKSNTWAKNLTVAELKKMWEPESKINNWKDVRPGFPDQKLALYGPGHDSGTFDYFTKAIVGKEKSSRSDFTASEDDNVLVKGIAGDKGGLGYFGFAYYEANAKTLNLIAVKDKNEVAPTSKTIANGSYTPLSRPLFIYASIKSLIRPEVAAFTNFYIKNADHLANQVGYVGLGAPLTALVQKRLDARATGSMYSDVTNQKVTISDLLKKQNIASSAHSGSVAKPAKSKK